MSLPGKTIDRLCASNGIAKTLFHHVTKIILTVGLRWLKDLFVDNTKLECRRGFLAIAEGHFLDRKRIALCQVRLKDLLMDFCGAEECSLFVILLHDVQIVRPALWAVADDGLVASEFERYALIDRN
jgi:hypothetical protein